MAAGVQEPTLRASIPIRYSPDGRSWGEGIVTSISGVTLVVQTPVVPDVRARLYFALGLGPEPTFHGEGRVTTPPDPEPGGTAISGFGLRFDGTPNEIAAATTKLLRAYPGPVEIDADLRLKWPVGTDAALPPVDPGCDGLGLWADGRLVRATNTDEGPAARTGSISEPLHAYVAVLRQLGPDLVACGTDRVLLTYRGRPLAPGSGLPAQVLSAGIAALDRIRAAGTAAAEDSARSNAGGDAAEVWSLDLSEVDEPTGPIDIPPPAGTDEAPTEAEVLWDHPVLELAAVQMRVMDALALADWRYQRLTPELKEAMDRDRTVLDGIHLRIATSAEDAGIDEAVTTAIAEANEAIDTLVTRAAWHSSAIETAEASASFYETFQIEKERLARQAVIAARTSAREAEEKATARKERDEPRKPEPKKKTKTVEPRGTKARADRPETGEPQKPRTAALAVILVVSALAIARIVSVMTEVDRKAAPPAARVDFGRLRADITRAAPAFPVVDMRIENKLLKVIVDPGWLSRGGQDRQGDLEQMSVALIGQGFVQFDVITPDGQPRARFTGAKFEVQGVATTSAEDGAR